MKESVSSRNLAIPRKDKRVENYFFQFKPHDKTFEHPPQKKTKKNET